MPALLLALALAADPSPLGAAYLALNKGDPATARKLAEELVKADPKDRAALDILGRACAALRDHAAAAEAFGAVVALDPKDAFALDRRGDAHLKLGKWDAAVADFDKVLALKPDLAPEHWRRGIALYYAGRYKDGAKQFETHKTANPEDVENAAWHYLCNAKVVDRDKARKELIAVTRDPRVPMAEVQKLFAGELKPADVLAAAEKQPADSDAGAEARFYANLYVGLWYEAEDKPAEAKAHLTAAAEKYKIGHYMWDVAAAHAALLAKGGK